MLRQVERRNSAAFPKIMPHFHFEMSDNGLVTTDPEGLDFPDLDTARREALKTLSEIARDKLPDGDQPRDRHYGERRTAGARAHRHPFAGCGATGLAHLRPHLRGSAF